LFVVDREIDKQMGTAAANQRVHIEKLTSIRRAVRSTYVLVLERWLQPFSERAASTRKIDEALARVRRDVDDFIDLAPVSPNDPEAARAVATAVASWSDHAERVAREDHSGGAHELRERLDEVDRTSDVVLQIDSTTGTSTDARVARLHDRQGIIQLAFGGVVL